MKGIFNYSLSVTGNANRFRKILSAFLAVAMVLTLTAAGSAFADSTGFSLLYLCRNTTDPSSQIMPYFKIVNNSPSTVELSTMKIRYWYTNDNASSESYTSWWASCDKSNVTSSIGDAAAGHYLELGFSSGAGSLAAGSTCETNGVINRSSGQYTQAGDYSYDPTKTTFTQWDHVTLYKDGVLVWGIEPSSSTPTPTATPTPTSTPDFYEDFEDGTADNFTSTGTWSVLQDSTKVYNAASLTARAWVGDSLWADYQYQADVKVNSWDSASTAENQSVGLLARFSDSSNYYAFLCENGQLMIKKKVSGTLTTLASTDFTLATSTWYTFKAEVGGSTLELTVGDTTVSATDSTFASGKVGLVVFESTSTSFDNMNVRLTGSLASPTPTPAPTPTPTTTSALTLDQFGIGMLYATGSGGDTWYNKWGTSEENISVASAAYDPNDSQLQFRGDGSYIIYGSNDSREGQLKLSGAAPRIYVYNNTNKWTNVEVTFYGYTESYNTSSTANSYAGLEAVVQTDHSAYDSEIDADPSLLCYTRGYGGRLLFDGRCDIEKECVHHNEPGEKQAGLVYPWSNSGTMPLQTWIGYKIISRSCENDTKMKIEIWIDTTNGTNGGTWQKVTEFTDYDGWSSQYEDGSTINSCCETHRGKVLNDPEYCNTVYLRTDALDGEGNCQYYKYFSICEVDPLP